MSGSYLFAAGQDDRCGAIEADERLTQQTTRVNVAEAEGVGGVDENNVDVARESGLKILRQANELVDNSFAESLDKSGFLKELWGGKLPN